MKNPTRSITEYSPEKINEIIYKGKQTIQDLLYEVDNEYSVSAMRLTNLPWVEAPLKSIMR